MFSFLVRESETPSESHPSSHVCVERKTQSSWWTLSPACAGCVGCGRGHTAPHGAQPGLFLSCPRDLGQEHCGSPGPAARTRPTIPAREQGGQEEPKAHQQVQGLEARWEDILQARVRTEPQLGSQGWAQLHDWDTGLSVEMRWV